MTPNPQSVPSLPYLIVRFAVEAAWWLVLLVPVLFAVLVPTGGAMRYRTPVTLEILEPSFRIVRTDEGVLTSAEVVPEDLQGVLMVGTGPGIGNWILLGGGYLVALAVVWLVRSIVRSLRAAPFDRRNVHRIRMIGVILLAFQVALPFVRGMQSNWVAESLHVVGARVSVPMMVELNNFLYPLLLLVLAEVFQRGARIEAEQELTI